MLFRNGFQRTATRCLRQRGFRKRALQSLSIEFHPADSHTQQKTGRALEIAGEDSGVNVDSKMLLVGYDVLTAAATERVKPEDLIGLHSVTKGKRPEAQGTDGSPQRSDRHSTQQGVVVLSTRTCLGQRSELPEDLDLLLYS